jgi:DNA-binding NarL/FixJ family response regulator
MTRVLVVDDHTFFRQTLADLLDASPDLEVVGQCEDGGEVVDAVAALHPDIVLMDIRMKEVSGLEAAARLQRAGTGVRVLMISSDVTPTTVGTAQGNGASGFVFKGSSPDQVVEAVRTVASGGSVWPSEPPQPVGSR